jgi:hypothetical protein
MQDIREEVKTSLTAFAEKSCIALSGTCFLRLYIDVRVALVYTTRGNNDAE